LRAISFTTLTNSGDVAVLTIDRAPANAMNLELLAEVVSAVGELAAALPAALVIAGRDGCFSAGVDLKAAPGYDAAQQRQMVTSINAMVLGVYGLPCPVVGAITGHAIAGGMVLAVCTDLRVAAEAGSYGVTEIKVGVPYPQAAIGVLRAELAPHAARVLVLGSELVDAARCLALGVFDEVVAPDVVLARAIELATGLAAYDSATYARTKRELRGATIESLRAAADDDPLLERWIG
jgi:enoyl-CoA hydratase